MSTIQSSIAKMCCRESAICKVWLSERFERQNAFLSPGAEVVMLYINSVLRVFCN